MVGAAAIAALAWPAAAQGRTAERGPEATVRTYLGALQRHDARAACKLLLDVEQAGGGRVCRSYARLVLERLTLRHIRIAPVLQSGAQARTVVEVVALRGPEIAFRRARVVLRHEGGRWRIAGAGTLPGPYATSDADPGRGTTPQRLAEDVLLGLSGNGGFCASLAPGAPLGGSRTGACRIAGADRSADALRLTRSVVHRTGATRVRLDVEVAATRATRTARRPGYVLRTHSWSDTLHAIRVGGRWRLVKPSRSFYRAVGVLPPADVDAPDPTATWPVPVQRPSLSERPVPARCAVPSRLWPAGCTDLDGLAAAPRPGGGALVGWSAGSATTARPALGGLADGSAATVDEGRDGDAWTLVGDGLLSLSGGLLAIEQDQETFAVRAIPLEADGRPRGPAQTVDPGVGNPDDGEPLAVLPAPPGAAQATLLLDGLMLVRLGPDGRRIVPDVRLAEPDDYDGTTMVTLSDGSLLHVDAPGDGAVAVGHLTQDGRPVGAEVHQPLALAEVEARTAAVAADGRVLVVWTERSRRRDRVLVRAWLYDPHAPLDDVPVTLSDQRVRAEGDEDEVFEPAGLSARALPDGGWGVAFFDRRHRVSDAAPILVVRLDGAARPRSAPQPVGMAAERYSSSVALAGDTVAWVEPSPAVGLPQVQAAPLP